MAKKVVIVDDSVFLVKKLTDFLESSMGYVVVATGSDGQQAVDLFRKLTLMGGVEAALGPVVGGHAGAPVVGSAAPKSARPSSVKCGRLRHVRIRFR